MNSRLLSQNPDEQSEHLIGLELIQKDLRVLLDEYDSHAACLHRHSWFSGPRNLRLVDLSDGIRPRDYPSVFSNN